MLQNMAFALANVVPSAVKTGLFTAKCSVFGPQIDGSGNVALGPTGMPTGVYDNPLLQNIACMDAVPRDMTIEATEMREIKEIQSRGYRHVLLAGDYYNTIFPAIEGTLQAVITDADGVTTTYNLFGCEPDSQNRMTRLHVEVISV